MNVFSAPVAPVQGAPTMLIERSSKTMTSSGFFFPS